MSAVLSRATLSDRNSAVRNDQAIEADLRRRELNSRETGAFRNGLKGGESVSVSGGVVTSIIMLKAAAVGGVTRSGLGTSSAIAARPPGFSAAYTLRMKVMQVDGSKWCRKLVISTRS
jgi:hypothetical protein